MYIENKSIFHSKLFDIVRGGSVNILQFHSASDTMKTEVWRPQVLRSFGGNASFAKSKLQMRARRISSPAWTPQMTRF